MHSRQPHPLFKGLALIGSLAVIGAVLRVTGMAEFFDTAWMDAHIRGHGLSGPLLFLVFGSVFTGLGLPRQIIAFLSGYAFGAAEGTLMALCAAMGGCILDFYYARWLGQGVIVRRFGRKLRKLNALLARNPFSMTLLIRFLPVGSNLLTNLVAGVSAIPARWFFLGSAAGYVPQTFIFALLGSGLRVSPVWRTTVSLVLFVASTLMGLALYRRYRLASLENEDAPEEEIPRAE